MSALEKIAHFQGRRDEVPNQELARQLAEQEDHLGIQEVAENLWNKEAAIQADCIKVLYEIGYLKPELVAGYAGSYIKLLRSRNNRLVWGGMIALSTVAQVAADDLEAYVPDIQRAMQRGSVITIDAGVLTLAGIASTSQERRAKIFPFLLQHLRSCRPKDVPQHSEKILAAVNSGNRVAFIQVLETRLADLSEAQVKRVRRVIIEAGTR